MGKLKRVWTVISSIWVIFFAYLMMYEPDAAFIIVSFMLAVLLMAKGLKNIIYYLSMAHHMVGGKIILYSGIFMFDLGVFAVSISDQSNAIIIIYLTAGHLLAGGIDVVQGVRNRKEGYSMWKYNLAQGAGNIIIALVCIIFRSSTEILVYVYCLCLIYLTTLKIISAFRKTAIVYIQ